MNVTIIKEERKREGERERKIEVVIYLYTVYLTHFRFKDTKRL